MKGADPPHSLKKDLRPMTTPSRARTRYEAFHPTEADRLVTLTEAADACQAEVKELRAEYLALSETLRLANSRLTRAWEAINRFNDELAEPTVETEGAEIRAMYDSAGICGACEGVGSIHNCGE